MAGVPMNVKRVVSIFIIFLLIIAPIDTINTINTFASKAASMSVSQPEPGDGVIRVSVDSDFLKKIRIGVYSVECRKNYYFAYFASDKTLEVPLMFGNGLYIISLFEEASDSYYYLVEKKTVSLDMADYDDAYLSSSVMAPWADAELTVAKANELTRDAENELDKFLAIYSYVVKNIEYDHEKVGEKRYRSSPDSTLEDRAGTCFDYAVLLASMLRCSGIKCKLVYGHVGGFAEFHAWNEAFINGRWIVVDTTVDAMKHESRMTYMYSKPAGQYKAEDIF